MQKPKSTEALLKTIFLGIGVLFTAMGLLARIGLLRSTASSQIQEPALLGRVFLGVGISFLAAALVFGVIAAKKNRLHTQLLLNGIRVNGTVESVYKQTSMQYGNQSPYRICYTYAYQGKVYHGKSQYLWERPELVSGDAVAVYTNEYGKSTISL